MKSFTAEVNGAGAARSSLSLNRWALVAALVWLCLSMGYAQQESVLFPEKPDPAIFVHDYASWLAPQEKAMLEEKLRRYDDSTSTQIVVMIRPDLGDYDRASYAFELGNRWGIGRKSKNNGVVVLIKTESPDRGAFIATGYGVEGALPDITAGRIIRNTMIPYFKQERYYDGINAGLDDIIRALSGEFQADAPKQPGVSVALVLFLIVVIVLIAVLFFVLAARRGTLYSGKGHRTSRRSRHDDWWGGGFGGGFGGGGSFGGGGGFGGGSFGGGSFGGGGAGGGW